MQTQIQTLAICAALATPLAAQQPFFGAEFEVTGTGCVADDNALYEIFDASSPFDLDGASVEFIDNGAGSYLFLPSPSLPRPFGAASNTAVDLMLSRTSVSSPQFLPFSIPVSPFGGATFNTIEVSANGYVYLAPGTIGSSRSGSALTYLSSFIEDGPCLAVWGTDLAPAAGINGAGHVWFDVQSVGTNRVVVITWDGVADGTNQSQVVNCQVQLWDDGKIVMNWFGVPVPSLPTVVGWSAGSNQPDLGPTDLSSLPLNVGTGNIRRPLALSAPTLPVINSPFQIDINDVPPNTIALALLIGAHPLTVDLGILGAPSCSLYTNADMGAIPVALPAVGLPAVVDFGVIDPGGAIPNDGINIVTQAAALVPGINPFGIVTSDRGTIQIGSDINTATGIIVRLEGTDPNYCGRPALPFWSVTNNSATGERVQSVKFDLYAGGPQVALGQSWFDPDGNCLQFGGMGSFEAGNSSFVSGACGVLGPYGGTDWQTGLIYPGSDVSPCDPSANTGWIGSHFQTNGPAAVEFRFNNFTVGKQFAFDADVDGGPAGADGLNEVLVTVVTDQRTISGTLVVLDPDTAAIAF